ncbi:MAG: choice-of-anchor L domain-containing protein, partial [Myxococcales bacterium]|nr:choice-of-anchor L domain-containing protein [Myxococcales bacterium]
MRWRTVALWLFVAGVGCSDDGSSSADTGGAPSSGTAGGPPSSGTFATGGGSPNPCPNPPDADGDGDGWTFAEGDCNDCDANANPGAIEVIGDAATPSDEDCDGMVDEVELCDTGLAIDDTDPMNGARAIELCRTASAGDDGWGVLSAVYHTSPNLVGDPDLQYGLLDSFGNNVVVRKGERMLALSSGRARAPNQPDACTGNKCQEGGVSYPPVFFPQTVPGCPGSTEIYDDISLELELRAPTNANGYAFDFKFHSHEFPYYVCSAYNDQFIALVTPPPDGSINGNISFDSTTNPVSVNMAYFDVCRPGGATEFAQWCQMTTGGCPSPPDPYCPSGDADLLGTGFDTLSGPTWGGATSWLTSTAPIAPGETF